MPATTVTGPNANPFTQTDLKRANEILYELNILIEEFERQEACGFNCGEGKVRREDLVNRILAWKKAYFPNKS